MSDAKIVPAPAGELVAVPYLRVSETQERRGQDPQRQLGIIEPWASREGVTLLEPVIDDGTSASKTSPFERDAFLQACERAKAAGATAIVVECSDRFSRQGAKLDAWSEVELERRYGLRLLRADKPLAFHREMVGNVSDAISAESAAAWVKAHASKVKSGMARAKAEKGRRYGRPAKDLTPAELELVRRLRTEEPPRGYRKCALEVSKRRGAFDVADPVARRKRTVSYMHVQRQYEGWLRRGGTGEEAGRAVGGAGGEGGP